MSWKRLILLWKRIIATAAAISTIFLTSWIVWILSESAFRPRVLSFTTINVPKLLSDNGYGSEIVTRMLIDEIRILYRKSATTMDKGNTDGAQDLSGVNIPGAGISLNSIASSIRRLLPEGWNNELSGEITISGKRFVFIIRLNGDIVYEGKSVDLELTRTFIEEAAYKIVERTRPYVIAHILFQKDDFRQAIEKVDEIILLRQAERKDIDRAWVLKGLLALKEGKYLDAELFYKKASNTPVSRNNIGDLYFMQGNFIEAEREYVAALNIDRAFALAHFNLGKLYERRGLLNLSEAQYRKATLSDKKIAVARLNLGRILRLHSKLSEAEAEFRMAVILGTTELEYHKAINLDPELALSYHNLAVVLSDQGKSEESKIYYKKSLYINNNSAITHYSLASLLNTIGELDEAEIEFRETLRLNKNQDKNLSFARTHFATLLYELGKFEEARSEYRKSIEEYPNQALAYYNYSILLREQGDLTEANRQLLIAKKLDPKLLKMAENDSK